MDYPFEAVTDLGESIDLTDFAPHLVQRLACEAMQRRLERTIARTSGEHPTDLHARVWALSAQPFIKSTEARTGLTVENKGTLRSVITECVWSQTRLAEAGYDVDSSCPLCHSEEDTVWHHCWQCQAPAAVEARGAFASPELVRRALAAGPSSLYYNTGIIIHPGPSAPPGRTPRLSSGHRSRSKLPSPFGESYSSMGAAFDTFAPNSAGPAGR